MTETERNSRMMDILDRRADDDSYEVSEYIKNQWDIRCQLEHDLGLAQAELEVLREIAKKLEWTDDGGYQEECCSICRVYRRYGQHTGDCLYTRAAGYLEQS